MESLGKVCDADIFLGFLEDLTSTVLLVLKRCLSLPFETRLSVVQSQVT